MALPFSLPQKHTAADVTIFTEMSSLAARYKAINLAQGFPDFSIDDRLNQYLFEAACAGHNQYAPMSGSPQLRNAIAYDMHLRYGFELHENDEITICPGATYGLYVAIASVIEKGDEVIILEPAYDSYRPAVEMNGGHPVFVSLADDFSVDWDEVKDAIGKQTKAIIINNPNNPSGSVMTEEDIHQLAKIAEQYHLIVISDEVYEQLVYDGRAHNSVWSNEILRQRSFVVFSFGKVFQQTGWKVGYVLSCMALCYAFRKVHQYLCFSVNTPAQIALAQYLHLPDKPNIGIQLQHSRDLLIQLLANTPFQLHTPAAGSYFQLADYSALSNQNDQEFVRWLVKEVGVAIIPLSSFYHNQHDQKLVRFCFAKKDETLIAAATAVQKALEKSSN